MEPDVFRDVPDEIASYVDHVRRDGDPADLASPAPTRGTVARLRISRLPSFQPPRGVRIDVRTDDATLVRFHGSAATSALLSRAQLDRSGLLDAIERAISRARLRNLGLDGHTVLLELADRTGYRGMTSWSPSTTQDADVFAVAALANALATQFCAAPAHGSW